eukprot:scaffold4133_cov310-Prasinococcus_capsulatus_cf.AAC.2
MSASVSEAKRGRARIYTVIRIRPPYEGKACIQGPMLPYYSYSMDEGSSPCGPCWGGPACHDHVHYMPTRSPKGVDDEHILEGAFPYHAFHPRGVRSLY